MIYYLSPTMNILRLRIDDIFLLMKLLQKLDKLNIN